MIAEAIFPNAAATLPGPTHPWWFTSIGGLGNPNPRVVTPESSLQYPAVFACTRVRYETMKQLPFHIMKRDGMFRWPVPDHPVARLLRHQPNHWMTAGEFIEGMQANVDLRGNAYAQIVPGPSGPMEQLIPLHPDRMKVGRLRDLAPDLAPPDSARLGYEYTPLGGGASHRFTQDEIFHLRGLSFDGIVGLSPIAVCRKAVELGRQMEDHGLQRLRNGGAVNGALRLQDGRTFGSDEKATAAIKRMARSWKDQTTGDNRGSTPVLEDGAEWVAMGLNNEELQWLQSNQYQARNIAAIYRVPLHLVMDWERLTYNNAITADIGFVKHTMLPVITMWEQAIWRDLLIDRDTYYPKFSVNGLLRGDVKARGEYYKALWHIGAINENEIRAFEDLNPIEGGDTYFVPVNMMPLGTAAAMQVPTGSTAAAVVAIDATREERIDACIKSEEAGEEVVELDVDAEVARLWAADIARRLAAGESAEIATRLSKGVKQSEAAWKTKYWHGKHQSWATKELGSIVGMAGAVGPSAEAVAKRVVDYALSRLGRAESLEAVASGWAADRETEIQDTILEEIGHGRSENEDAGNPGPRAEAN